MLLFEQLCAWSTLFHSIGVCLYCTALAAASFSILHACRQHVSTTRILHLAVLSGTLLANGYVLTANLCPTAGHYFNRARVIAIACFMWAIFTGMFAFSTSIHQAMVIWAFNGIGLAWMVPNGQSLVADYYDATHRGRAFGVLLSVGKHASSHGWR